MPNNDTAHPQPKHVSPGLDVTVSPPGLAIDDSYRSEKMKEPDYKTYCIQISNYGGVSNSTTIPGKRSVSEAVEYFLRDFLENPNVEVKIDEISSYRKAI